MLLLSGLKGESGYPIVFTSYGLGENPKINIWGIDTYGSVFKKYHETGDFDENEIYPYITEGIGEDILPKNVDFSLTLNLVYF